MNILFVYSLDHVISLDKPLFRLDQIQFGISYISSFLKNDGNNTELIILSPFLANESKSLIHNKIEGFKPSIICYTAVSTQYEFISNIAKDVKTSYPDIFQLVGGPHSSLNPDEVINDVFDALCIGEGELPTLELVSAFKKDDYPNKIKNLWIKHKDSVEKNETRPFIEDLDSIPFPDRQMWLKSVELSKELGSKKEFISILLGRGCPFECSFCCNHALRKLSEGKYVRYRSPENIMKEINFIDNEFKDLETIYMEVETICLKNDWIINLCSRLEDFNKKRIKPLSFGTNLRITPNCNFSEIFLHMQKANFKFLNLGLESGSEKLRREVLRRNYSNGDFIKNVNLAKEHGLSININNLIGLPGETPADFEETIEVNRKCQPNEARLGVFYPYPGTDLYTYCVDNSLIDDNKTSKNIERRHSVLNLPYFPNNKIEYYYTWFQYKVYKGHKPLKSLVKHTVDLKLNNYPYFKNYLLKVYRTKFMLQFRRLIKKLY